MSRWSLRYDQYLPEEEKLRETLCSLGNGLWGVRSSFEDALQDTFHYPGLYLLGGFNKSEHFIEDKNIENEDLINWPNPFFLSFRIKKGKWFSIDHCHIESFYQELHFKKGFLLRRFKFIFEDHRFFIESKRFLSMSQSSLFAMEWSISSEDDDVDIEIKTSIDGKIRNSGVSRYEDFFCKHYEVEKTGQSFEDTLFMNCQSLRSKIFLSIQSKLKIAKTSSFEGVQRFTEIHKEECVQVIKTKLCKRKQLKLEKLITIVSSKDFALSSPFEVSQKLVQRRDDFIFYLSEHQRCWSQIWQKYNMSFFKEHWETKVLRLHLFHLIQIANHNVIGHDTSVPARGLNGEAYRGHIFWDELFIFPLLYFRSPLIARSLLMYRYRRLNEARFIAKSKGYDGALFPWQSASEGSEVGQVWHKNPLSKRWIKDDTTKQVHINGAIAYNVIKYFEATQDMSFLTNYGIEILLEICRFWFSILTYSETKKRYEILNVVGPDEFHTRYPGEVHSGINNNAYTNFLASWCIKETCSLFDSLDSLTQKEVLDKLLLKDDDLSQWRHASQKIFIPFFNNNLCSLNEKTSWVIEQFEGFNRLRPFPWNEYRGKYGFIERLDRILEKEKKDINDYQVTKQADVLMIFYLFSFSEVQEIFSWMGYSFESSDLKRNVHYYMLLTTHGSSLSRIVHSWVSARLDRKRSWDLFKDALKSDLFDTQRGTTSEGIHLGSMAGTVDIVQRCFTGIRIKNNIFWISPKIPTIISGFRFSLCYRNQWLNIHVYQKKFFIQSHQTNKITIQIGHKDMIYDLNIGEKMSFLLDSNENDFIYD